MHVASRANEIDFKVDRRLKNARLYRSSDGSIEIRSPATLSKRSKTTIISQIESGKIILPPIPVDISYPDSIQIPLTGGNYKVHYGGDRNRRGRVVIDATSVTLPTDNPSQVNHLLGTFLKTISREPLTELLSHHLEANGHAIHRVRIGLPNGRWASRSSTGTIALSARLILLEEPLIEGVMLHEIAHIAHMNHSNEFYRHLERLDPMYRARRSEIKKAEATFEPWVRALR